jgi:hypothetical protein
MKWLLFAALLVYSAARAQQVDLATKRLERYRAELDEQRESIVIGAADLRYSRGYILARSAGLYRSTAAIRKGVPAFRLKLGDKVFLVSEKDGTRWLRVARHTYRKTRFGQELSADTDTVVYYMRASAIESKNGIIRSFQLH